MTEFTGFDASPNEGKEPPKGGGLTDFINTVAVPGGVQLKALERGASAKRGVLENTARGGQTGLSFGLDRYLAMFASAMKEPGFDLGAAKSNIESLEAKTEEMNPGFADDAGEMLGLLMPGTALVKGAEKGLKAGGKVGKALWELASGSAKGRISAGAVMGAAENASYEAINTGSIDDAGIDALYGAGGGAIGSAVFAEMAGPLAGWTMKKFGLKSQDAAVDSVRRAIKGNFASIDNAGEVIKFDPDSKASWDAVIAAAPKDANLLDMFPEALAPLIKQRGATRDTAARDALWPIIKHVQSKKEASAAEFQKLADDVLDFTDPNTFMSKAQLLANSKAIRMPLSQQYTDILTSSQFKMNAASVKKLLRGAFDGKDMPVDDTMLRQIDDLVGESYTPRTNGGKPIKDRRGKAVMTNRKLGAQELMLLRKDLDEIAYSGKFTNPNASSASSASQSKVADARNALRTLMHDSIPGLGELDKVYADDAAIARYHDIGRKLFSDTKENESLKQALSDPFMPAYGRQAMLNGAKAAVRSDLAAKGTPAQIRAYMMGNNYRMSKMRTVFTDAQMDKMDEGIKQLASAAEVGKLKIQPEPEAEDAIKSIPGMFDWLIAGSNVSKAAQVGAARRIAGRQGAPGSAGFNEQLAETVGLPLQQGLTKMDANMAARGPRVEDAAMLGGAGGTLAPQAPDKQEQQPTLFDMVNQSRGMPPQ